MVIIDALNGTRSAQLRGWLERNTVATTLVTADSTRARALLAEHGIEAHRLPVALLYDGTLLIDPMETEIAEVSRAFQLTPLSETGESRPSVPEDPTVNWPRDARIRR
jgi:predicted nucleic acid-binding protein